MAGLRLDCDEWIRPVSEGTESCLSRRHYVLNDGSEASILDVIEIHVSEHRPKPYQPENWMIGSEKWKLIKRLKPEEAYQSLKRFLICGPEIFGNTIDSVPLAGLQEKPVTRSLILVQPTNIKWYISSYNGKRTNRAIFDLDRTTYNLVITDPIWEKRLNQISLGAHPREAIGIEPDDIMLFTISLGGPFQGNCYKLIAGIICIPNS